MSHTVACVFDHQVPFVSERPRHEKRRDQQRGACGQRPGQCWHVHVSLLPVSPSSQMATDCPPMKYHVASNPTTHQRFNRLSIMALVAASPKQATETPISHMKAPASVHHGACVANSEVITNAIMYAADRAKISADTTKRNRLSMIVSPLELDVGLRSWGRRRGHRRPQLRSVGG